MFAVAYDHEPISLPAGKAHPHATRIAEILAARQQVISGRDLLYCSHPIRALIEEDIPLLVRLLREES